MGLQDVVQQLWEGQLVGDVSSQSDYTLTNGLHVFIKGMVSGGPVTDSVPREVAAWELADALGLAIVPPVVEKVIGGERYSVHMFVSGSHWRGDMKDEEQGEFTLLDTLTGNSDRHGSNIMVDKSGKAWAIDNALTFGKGVGNHRMGFRLGDVYGRMEHEKLSVVHQETLVRLDVASLPIPREYRTFVAKQAGRMLKDKRYLVIGSVDDVKVYESESGKKVKE